MHPAEPRTAIPAGLRAIEAQRILDLIALKVTPALVAGVIAYLHMGKPGFGLLVAVSMLAALQFVERSALPLQLMPAARLTLGFCAPVLGGGLALSIMLAAGAGIAVSDLEAAVISAWLVMILGVWVKARFEEGRRVRVAVIGSAGFAHDLAGELQASGIRAYDVVGWFGSEDPSLTDRQLHHLGDTSEIRSSVITRRIELIVYARDESTVVENADTGRDICALIADSCLDLPVRTIEANQFYEELLGHVPLGTTDAAWFRYIMHPRFRPTSPLWKRCFDLAIASLMVILALPLVGLAALAIKLTEGGPVFYRQRRVGERGREFKILKLRTMVPDAERDGPRWCEPGDARVTPLGRLLRRTHVDELPQLWNVLRGEMTLVGPRPERPELVADLERRFSHYTRRHLVKPGIAGWAQVRCGYAGSDLGTAWKLCHDLFYIKRRSLLADSMIMLETAFQVGRDAHRALRAPQQRFIVSEFGD